MQNDSTLAHGSAFSPSFFLSFSLLPSCLFLSLGKISCPISCIRYQPQWNDLAPHEKFSHHLAVFGQLGSIGGPTFYKQGCRIGRVHMGVQWMNQFEPCAFQVPDGDLGPSDQSGFQMDGWDESVGPYIYLSRSWGPSDQSSKWGPWHSLYNTNFKRWSPHCHWVPHHSVPCQPAFSFGVPLCDWLR